MKDENGAVVLSKLESGNAARAGERDPRRLPGRQRVGRPAQAPLLDGRPGTQGPLRRAEHRPLRRALPVGAGAGAGLPPGELLARVPGAPKAARDPPERPGAPKLCARARWRPRPASRPSWLLGAARPRRSAETPGSRRHALEDRRAPLRPGTAAARSTGRSWAARRSTWGEHLKSGSQEVPEGPVRDALARRGRSARTPIPRPPTGRRCARNWRSC